MSGGVPEAQERGAGRPSSQGPGREAPGAASGPGRLGEGALARFPSLRWVWPELRSSYIFIFNFFPGSWLWKKWKNIYSDHTVDVLVREEERFHSH